MHLVNMLFLHDMSVLSPKVAWQKQAISGDVMVHCVVKEFLPKRGVLILNPDGPRMTII